MSYQKLPIKRSLFGEGPIGVNTALVDGYLEEQSLLTKASGNITQKNYQQQKHHKRNL
jgi:hypothetical protein